MTPADQVTMYEASERLSEVLLADMNEQGFSRYPVFQGNRSNIIGILYVKGLTIEEDDIAINETTEAFETSILNVRSHEKLDVVLGKMLKSKHYIAIVSNRNAQFQGVISLEDIIE